MSTEMSARSFSSSSRSLARPFKVLFCGHEFSNGYLFSKAALSRKLPTVVTTQCSRENLHKELADADVVVPLMCKMGHAELQIGKNIRMIMQYGVGLEGVDVPAATQAGVWVCKIPSEGTGNAQSCAEHAIFLSLALLRNMSEMKRSLLSGGLGLPMGRTLFKSTAIVYGYGGIGKQLVNRLKAFEMNIIVVSRNGADDVHTETEPGGGGSSVICIRPQQMATTLEVRSADVLYVCCSQNAENMGFVNKAFLSGLKPGVMLVNVARGGLLNYEDVHEGLINGTVGGLGTDVFAVEPFPSDALILQHPNVVATPHIAGVTEVSYRSMAEKVAENVDRIMRNLPPVDAVNVV